MPQIIFRSHSLNKNPQVAQSHHERRKDGGSFVQTENFGDKPADAGETIHTGLRRKRNKQTRMRNGSEECCKKISG
ncbi:hypothetical protein KM043_016885 [Ampulex compressa]|nr:hypothetical protein KM043_016885 [Ampulex compressa]